MMVKYPARWSQYKIMRLMLVQDQVSVTKSQYCLSKPMITVGHHGNAQLWTSEVCHKRVMNCFMGEQPHSYDIENLPWHVHNDVCLLSWSKCPERVCLCSTTGSEEASGERFRGTTAACNCLQIVVGGMTMPLQSRPTVNHTNATLAECNEQTAQLRRKQ